MPVPPGGSPFEPPDLILREVCAPTRSPLAELEAQVATRKVVLGEEGGPRTWGGEDHWDLSQDVISERATAPALYRWLVAVVSDSP